MITTEEIATRVYAMLQASEVKNFISGVIDYERNDYTKEDVIIVPHTIDGEASVRYGQINIRFAQTLHRTRSSGSLFRGTSFSSLFISSTSSARLTSFFTPV